MRRIVTLVLLFFAVCGGMVYVKGIYDGPRYHTRPPAAQQYRYADGEAPFAQIKPAMELYHTVDGQIVDLERSRNPEMLVSLDGVMPAVAEWLAGRKQLVERKGVTPHIIPRRIWNYEKIIQEPSRWRWQTMHIYGRVMRYYPVNFPSLPAGMRKLFLVVLQDEFEKTFFTVLTPAVSQDIVKTDPEGYVLQTRTGAGLAAFDGVFMLNFPYYIADSGRRKDETPLFFAERVYNAAEPRVRGLRLDEWDDPAGYADIAPAVTVPGLDVNFLRDKFYVPAGRVGSDGETKVSHMDLDIAADLRSEKSAIDHVFQYLWAKNPQELAVAARNPEMTYVNLMSQKTGYEWMIGQAANFYGVALSLQILRFADAPEVPDNSINRLYLLTAGDARYRDVGRFTWTLCTPNLPRNLRQGDWIRADGVFCKLFPYKTVSGIWQWSPLLLCKNIVPTTPPPSPLMPKWLPEKYLPWVMAFAVAVLIGWWWYFRSAGRKDNVALESLVQKTRARNKPKLLKKKTS